MKFTVHPITNYWSFLRYALCAVVAFWGFIRIFSSGIASGGKVLLIIAGIGALSTFLFDIARTRITVNKHE